MNLILSGGKDLAKRLFSEKLFSATKHQDVASEAHLYRLENDIPYIVWTMIQAIDLLQDVDLDVSGIWLIKISRSVINMDPVQARSIADKILLSLAIRGRLPKGYSENSACMLGRKMYEVASWKYPLAYLRPHLSSMSSDFPVWVKVLPHFSREISLII